MSSISVPPLVEIPEETFAFHGFPRLLVSDKMVSICFLYVAGVPHSTLDITSSVGTVLPCNKGAG